MQIRNANGKLVCKVDETKRTIEIIDRGYKTVVCFKADGYVEVKNTKLAS